MKKAFVLLLTVMLVLNVASCDTVPPADIPDGTSAGATGTTAPTDTATSEELTIASGGATEYVIVRPNNCPATINNIVSALSDAIIASSGVKPSVLTEKTYKSDKKYISIGASGLKASDDAYASLGYGEWSISCNGENIIIASYSDDGLMLAINRICSLISLQKETVTLKTSELIKRGSVNRILNYAPKLDGNTPQSVYNGGDGVYTLIFKNSSKNQFDEYLRLIEGSGFTLYESRGIGDNRFATLTNDVCTLNLQFTAYSTQLRLTVESAGAIQSVDTGYAETYPSSVTQLGLEYMSSSGTTVQNGMSYVFRLSDGSFIIIDGGYRSTDDARRLRDKLTELSGGMSHITIAAWIITHAHADHNGAIVRFAELYADSGMFTVERVIFNYPPESENVSESDSANRAESISAITALHAESVTAHSGQHFGIRNADIDILYTHEDMAPVVTSSFNNTSLVFTVKLATQTFLFLGDAESEAQQIVANMYGELNCDFVQAAHHGYSGGSDVLYKLIKPSYVFWPIGSASYDKVMSQHDYNVYLRDLASVRRNIVAGSTDITLMLPYTLQ